MRRELLDKNPWMEAESAGFGAKGGDYDFSSSKHVSSQQKALGKQSAALESLSKRINKKVLSMFEKVHCIDMYIYIYIHMCIFVYIYLGQVERGP